MFDHTAQQLAIDTQADTPFIVWLLEHLARSLRVTRKGSRYLELTSTGMIAFTRSSTEFYRLDNSLQSPKHPK
ncbi:hypothetical protein ACKFKF_04420 [Phormidesmis sp. 146-12]